ncbi:MAG: hypothetical protein ACRYGK_04405 [Janthinobacterium lividum]
MNDSKNEVCAVSDVSGATVIRQNGTAESVAAIGQYSAECRRISAEFHRKLQVLSKLARLTRGRLREWFQSKINALPHEIVWADSFPNLITTQGVNYLLDNGLAGSAFTAANYMGLISSASYSAIVAADTAASHAGWLEAGAANAPAYSGTVRPTCVWSAASARNKALSSSLSFTMSTPGTVKGSFISTSSVKDGTAGVLFSAGLFSGGDRAVIANDVITVAYNVTIN